MIVSLLLAQTQAATLAGVTLGGDVKDVVAAHHAKATAAAWGPSWSWTAAGVGVVRVAADADGNVALIDVVPAGSATIDLPAAPAFPIAGGHEKYTDASSFVESDACAAHSASGACFAYTLDDGELVLQFGDAGNGPLREAIWGDRAFLKTQGVIQAGTSI